MIAAGVILAALELRHDVREWAFFRDLRVGTGYGQEAEPRIDAWVINLHPSQNLTRISYEIKCSRSDFLAELRQPRKRRHALRLSNQFYFAAPRGLIKAEELPPEAGLIEVEGRRRERTADDVLNDPSFDGQARIVVRAQWRDTIPP